MSRRLGPRGAAAAGAAKLVNSLSRRLGRGSGTVAGGRVALALDPRLLERELADRHVFLVTGTNGKTTTTALLRAALGRPSVSNATGSNMPPGLVAALISSPAEFAVLEVDESWLGAVIDASRTATSVTVVLLNLSRDQLDRSSEVRQLALKWRGVLSDRERSAFVTVVANVNDPLVSYAAENAVRLIACAVPVVWRLDATSCPRCTRSLVFEPTGDWSCQCGLARPRFATAARQSI